MLKNEDLQLICTLEMHLAAPSRTITTIVFENFGELMTRTDDIRVASVDYKGVVLVVCC